MTAVIPMTGSTYHPRTPTPLTNLIHLQLGETTHREKPLSHDLLAKLVRHITIGTPWRAESATSDRHSRVRQSPFPSYVPLSPLPRQSRRPLSPTPTVPAPLPSSLSLHSLSRSRPPCHRPGFSFYPPRSVPRPQKQKKNNNEHTHRTPGPGPEPGPGSEQGSGEGTQRRTLSQTITTCRWQRAPLRGRSLPAARDHEGPLNNRAMRRRPVTLPISLLPSPTHYPIRVATPCFSLRSADARARETSLCENSHETRSRTTSNVPLPLCPARSSPSRSRLTSRCFLFALPARARFSAPPPCARTFSYYRYTIYPDARAIGPRRPM